MAENVEKRKELEKLAYEYQLLQAQAQLLAQNLELLALAGNELKTLRETLEGLRDMGSENPEVLIPIGGGSFLKGMVTDRERAVISMGAGYSAEMPIESAMELVDRRIKEYEMAIQRTQEALRKIEGQLQELARRAQSLEG